MIPIIQDIVKSCETEDTLSEFGFLGGMLVAGGSVKSAFAVKGCQKSFAE